jgi:hypothetical protein
MTRIAFLMASVLIPLPVAAATFVLGGDGSSPASPAPPPITTPARPLPVFHPPPSRTSFSIPPGFTPAPVPNLDLRAPSPVQGRATPELSGTLFSSPATSNVDNGYMFGSRYSNDLERRRPGVTISLAPTLNLKIPLQ